MQFHPGFPFSAAEKIADYLRDLGISHIYASPITAAQPGSEHGYDQIDPCRINPELGGAEGFQRLQRRCGETGLGWIQDIVPNHMAYSADNPLLADVLEKGPQSPYAGHFDLRWHHPHPALSGRLAAPFLGATYNECLENGDLGLDFREGRFFLRYFDVRLPLCPESYPFVLERALERLLSDSSEAAAGLEQVLLVCRDQSAGGAERASSLLRDIYGDNAAFRQWLDEFLERVNASPRSREGIRFLHRLVLSQHFAPVHWEMAGKEINYRRFFSINDLICLRQERREVFEDTHSLVFRLAQEGRLQGLRIDHLDGLGDPRAYLEQLRCHLPETYIVAEKILAPEEVPPASWPIQGTTGYDFLLHLTGVFCAPSGKSGFDALYAELDPEEARAGAEKIPEQKGRILQQELGGDLDNLTRELAQGICATPSGSDIALRDLRRAVGVLAAALPIYRTYIRNGPPTGGDGAYLRDALKRAVRLDPSTRMTLARLERFLFASSGDLGPEIAGARDEFLRQLQQTTGPLAAKGFEDTHLYTFNRLISLNDVGGDPHRFGLSPEAFHAFMRHRARNWPHSMSASATHDTKRGEDVRARLNVLSEMPQTWASHVREWRELNSGLRTDLGGMTAPDGNEEYLLYQTLVGTFPFSETDLGEYKRRIRDYLVKALREAKRNTSWHRLNPDWEKACLDFLDAILPDDRSGPFPERFIPFQGRIAHLGMINSLAQVLVKTAAPGVPDVYQGTELWDLNLVDPDNRREVDFSARRRYLERIRSGLEENPEALFREMYEHPENGMLKMHVLHRALMARRDNTDLFREGEYFPVPVEGPLRKHVLAFCRRRGDSFCLAVATRFPANLVTPPDWSLGREVWGETRIILPQKVKQLRDMLSPTDHSVEDILYIGDLLTYLPVSLLVPAKE